MKYFRNFNPLAPAMAGIAIKKENSLAAKREHPSMEAPKMVAPLREVPGTRAAISWNKPISKAV